MISSPQIEELTRPDQLDQAFLVLKELRPHLTRESYNQIYQAARRSDHYTFVGVFEEGRCTALMGYRILYDFVHGKHLYIDDLVVTKASRSQGMGAELLRYAEEKAWETQCVGLRLCTGVDNEPGRRFYEREHWELKAVAYKKKVDVSPDPAKST